MDGEYNQMDLFIGSKSSYEKYKRDNRIQTDDTEEINDGDKPLNKVESTVTVLSKDTLKEISEDMMTILKRTRCAHDYTEVYMQSSLDFYDEFYNDTEITEELKAARQIRRVYKNYADYLVAIEVRNNYIDTLVEKYGGADEFQRKMSIGLVQDWIPVLPILSKRSNDYELYLSGILPVTPETLPEGTICKIMEALQEEVEGVDVEEGFGTETSIGMIRGYEEYVDDAYSKWNVRRGSATVDDLRELNEVFKSWYKPDNGDNGKHEIFKNAPENIQKRFFEYCSYNEPGLLAKLASGEELEEVVPDQNEMVRDEKTGRSMTRHELEQRETIRLLKEFGWSESRLLNYSNVGSRLERMTRKKKASKKRRKRPGNENHMDDFFMNSPEGMDPTYSENDYMSDAFMSLMRGD